MIQNLLKQFQNFLQSIKSLKSSRRWVDKYLLLSWKVRESTHIIFITVNPMCKSPLCLFTKFHKGCQNVGRAIGSHCVPSTPAFKAVPL